MHGIYELVDFVHHGIHVATLISHDAEAELCALPPIIISDFGYGHIELVARAINDLPENMPLALKRIAFVNVKMKKTDSYYHKSYNDGQAVARTGLPWSGVREKDAVPPQHPAPSC